LTPSGENKGIVTFEPRLMTAMFGPGWNFQPKTGYRCGFAYSPNAQSLTLVDPPHRVVRQVKKRLNGKWFSLVSAFATAPDGTMAALCSDLNDHRNRCDLDFFSREAEPSFTIELPAVGTNLPG